MNHYYCSDGERVSQRTIDYRKGNAGRKAMQDQEDEYGYNFCVDCKKNTIHCGRLTASHIKSIQWCKDNRKTELIWDVNNIEPRCIPCHQIYDGLNIQ